MPFVSRGTWSTCAGWPPETFCSDLLMGWLKEIDLPNQLMTYISKRIPTISPQSLNNNVYEISHDCKRPKYPAEWLCLGDKGDSALRVSFLWPYAWTDLCGGSTLRCKKGTTLDHRLSLVVLLFCFSMFFSFLAVLGIWLHLFTESNSHFLIIMDVLVFAWLAF